MQSIINWLDAAFGALPLPLLEVWGRCAYVVGLLLAISAFGGFIFRPGGRWGVGRERQAWDDRAVLSIPLTFVLIIASGYLGSFIVLVPEAQTFESLKDLVVFLCVVLFGYPALISVPFAYGLSDLIEGVPPEFLLAWLPGYFINPACFWIAYQLLGRRPDFRQARTWGMYLLFVLLFMAIEPVLWGYICAGKFTAEVSYTNITSALFFTTGITWLLAPVAMLLAFPVAQKCGLFWAEIPGHVKQRFLGDREWLWESGGSNAHSEAKALTEGWPIRMVLLTPFIALVLLMVGATAYVTLRSAEDDANKLAGRLHQEIAANIHLQLDDYLARVPTGAVADNDSNISQLLKSLHVAEHGMAMVLDRSGSVIASSVASDSAVAQQAIASFKAALYSPEQLRMGVEFRFDHVIARPLSRETWLAHVIAYEDSGDTHGGARASWVVLTMLPKSYYLAGVLQGNSRSAMIFAIAMLLSLAVAAYLAAMVTARLRHMSQVTRALAQGDWTQRVPGSRMEELDILAHSFNDMAGQLEKSFADLLTEVDKRGQRERELEQSEVRLRTSENRMQLAIQAANLSVWDWDVEKDQLLWDDSMYQLYGVRREEFGGAYQAWSKCLAPEDLVRATEDVKAALRGERDFASDFRVSLANGSVRVIRGVGHTIRNEAGHPVRMVGFNWDVTEQLRIERTLQERETFLRLTQEAAHVGSWEWDIATNQFKWSDELAHIHGIRAADFDGRYATVLAFCHPEDVVKLRAAMRSIVESENLDGFECRIVRRDGLERSLWFLGQAVHDAHGMPVKVLGIAIDITERKQVEAALQANRQDLLREKYFIDTLMDSLPGVVFLSDAHGKLLKWNKSFEQVTGYDGTELATLTPLDLIPAGDMPAVVQTVQTVLRSGQDTIESHIKTKDGRVIPYYCKGVRLVTEQGPCLLGIGIDISERRRMEEQFRQAQKMEAIGHLAAGVAHDFNNLLMIILGHCDLLLSELTAEDPQRSGVKAIHKAGERAAALTHQLLAFSRQTVLQPKVLHANDVIRETEQMLRRIIGEDVLLATALDAGTTLVKVDPGQLGQVLMNLAVNARDAMPQGGRLTITTRNIVIDQHHGTTGFVAKPGNYVLLSVADTGDGMTSDIRARIFEPFFTTKAVGKGTGLGLSMVYGIVEQSGGHIEVHSEPGRGTTFNLYFPAVDAQQAEAKIDTALAIPVRHGTETVLLVEDEQGVRDLSALALETHGYQVLVAADGNDALRIASHHGNKISMLVTDVVMPGMSGRELAEVLRRRLPGLRVLYVSGYTDDAVVRHGLLHDQVEFLQKPYTPLTLARKVGDVFGH